MHAFSFQRARNLRLRDIEVTWEKPELTKWESALYVEDVRGLEIDGFHGRQAWPVAGYPAIQINRVQDAIVRACTTLPGTETFLGILGANTRDITLFGNDFRQAKNAYRLGPEVSGAGIREWSNIIR